MKFSSRDWIWFAICAALSLHVVTDFIRAKKLREQLDDFRVFTLNVQTIDQKTGHSIYSTILGPHLTIRHGQIMRLWSTAVSGPGSITFEYIGNPPFAGTLSVTNAGYQEKIVSFDSTKNQLLVYLTHKS